MDTSLEAKVRVIKKLNDDDNVSFLLSQLNDTIYLGRDGADTLGWLAKNNKIELFRQIIDMMVGYYPMTEDEVKNLVVNTLFILCCFTALLDYYMVGNHNINGYSTLYKPNNATIVNPRFSGFKVKFNLQDPLDKDILITIHVALSSMTQVSKITDFSVLRDEPLSVSAASNKGSYRWIDNINNMTDVLKDIVNKIG